MTRTVVIGGGFAGLAAAVELAARGRRPLLLEARSHLGGRAYSFTDTASGESIDNGQHAMMGCYAQTLAFLERIGAAGKLVRQPNLRVAMAHRRLGHGAIACAPLPGPLHMLSGVLGYRLLSCRERCQALLGGLRILRMYRRGDTELASATVTEVLDQVGQSPRAQACFWNPVAVATLNEAPARAAAAPFAAVLAKAFFGSRRDSQFILAGVGLSELYTDDARRFVERHGGTIALHTPAAALELADGRVGAVRLRDGERIPTDVCIAALPPRQLATLLPAPLQTAPPFASLGEFTDSPIVSIHLWLDRPVLEAEFLGLLGTTTHWLFNRSRLHGLNGGGQRLSAVISAGHEVVDWSNELIAATVVDELRAVVPAARAARLLHSVVVKEKRATISTTPASERLRPAVGTALRNFFLAGDWTATGLPPTIESAVVSGNRAATLAVEHLGHGTQC